MDFISFLVKKGLLTESDVADIKNRVQTGGTPVEEALNNHGVSDEEILEAKVNYYRVPGKELEGRTIPVDVLQYIPESIIERHKILPLAITDGVLEVGFVNPDDLQARDAVQFVAAKEETPYKIFAILEKDLAKVRESYVGLTGEVNKALSELETELSADEQKLSESIDELQEEKSKDSSVPTRIVEDAPVTKVVATILRYATEGGASDIHIEPLVNHVRVRFRVDGNMHTSLELPKKVQNAVIARVKILCNMKLDEKRKPQDGRFSAHIDGRKIDFRVSTFPTYYGEKVVMRILDSEKGVIAIDAMGMTTRNLKLIKEAVQRPYGMILISGPTGSGKTTTLYSMLNEVDRLHKNVLSLEDPVEYNMEGISQSQVRPEIGYTFATGLRTTLRQDPDIIMVGEIRDKETAQLAVQAALTGHLVLSTIHTNTSAGVIPRLIDMGVDPYLIAPTLILAIAQRLVKTLCPNSGKDVPVEGAVAKMIDHELEGLDPEIRQQIKIPPSVKEAAPGPGCPSGYKGRAAVFEVLPMTKDIENLLLDEPSEAKVFEIAQNSGMLSLRQDALLKAFQGIIPLEEVNKL